MYPLDQSGCLLPTDLVLLPGNMDLLCDDDCKSIASVYWYEKRGTGVLMASAKEIGFLSEDDPLDADVDIDADEIVRIDQRLHRWSQEDGFYHA